MMPPEPPAIPGFAVIQDAYDPERWHDIAEVLVEVLRVYRGDANSRAKRSPGFVADGLNDVQARQVQLACAAKGIATHIVQPPDVVVLPKPLRVHELWIVDNGLWVRLSQTGPRESVAWNSIGLIAVLPTTKTEKYHKWKTSARGVGKNIQYDLEVTNYSEDSAEWLADVIAAAPEGGLARYRLMSREINYAEALGTDMPDRNVQSDWRWNCFRLLIARIGDHAPQAQFPPETLQLLGRGQHPRCPNPSPHGQDDFDAYNRWLLQKARIERAEK